MHVWLWEICCSETCEGQWLEYSAVKKISKLCPTPVNLENGPWNADVSIEDTYLKMKHQEIKCGTKGLKSTFNYTYLFMWRKCWFSCFEFLTKHCFSLTYWCSDFPTTCVIKIAVTYIALSIKHVIIFFLWWIIHKKKIEKSLHLFFKINLKCQEDVFKILKNKCLMFEFKFSHQWILLGLSPCIYW